MRTNMTNKQKWTIALMCAVAAVLAALMLWRQPAAPNGAGHDAHQDSHGHDDRHPQAEGGPPADAGDNMVAMSDAQVKANGIAIDSARPALIGERLHLPARIAANAERTVALAAPAQGIVQSVAVSVGSAVRKGQVLAVIRSPAVAQWRAELAAARQRQALARTTYEREKSLWEQRISARQDLDAADAALKEAGIAVQAARQRLDALAIDGAGGDGLGVGLGVGISSALTVRAPLDGVVVDKPAVAGQAVDDSKPLLTIADLSQVWVEAAVPAGSLGQVGTGMAAQVSVGTRPQPIEGKVDLVGPVLGETSRMATARIVLANPQGALRPGMLASVDLLGPASTVAVTVASDAIQTVHERPVVFVRGAGGFRAQAVTVGRTDGKRTEIVGGLAAGTPYATAGSFLLKADLGKGEAEHED
jgi:cobalt-zinc-cadmium efflux system membrane fusion protein